MTVTLLNPGCDGVCNDCECPPPTATCSQSTDGGVRTVNWSVSGAVEAWIVKRCFGGYGYGDTETVIPITLTDGAASGAISPADTSCVYIVHAVNACDEEVTSYCFITCEEIGSCEDIDLGEGCNCIEWPRGRIRANYWPIAVTVNGFVRGNVTHHPEAGPVTFPDIDVSGTYNLIYYQKLIEFEGSYYCNWEFLEQCLLLYSQYWYTDSFGRDVYAGIKLCSYGFLTGSFLDGDPENGWLNMAGWQSLISIFYPCTTYGSCFCPQNIYYYRGTGQGQALNQPWEVDEITFSGIGGSATEAL